MMNINANSQIPKWYVFQEKWTTFRLLQVAEASLPKRNSPPNYSLF